MAYRNTFQRSNHNLPNVLSTLEVTKRFWSLGERKHFVYDRPYAVELEAAVHGFEIFPAADIRAPISNPIFPSIWTRRISLVGERHLGRIEFVPRIFTCLHAWRTRDQLMESIDYGWSWRTAVFTL